MTAAQIILKSIQSTILEINPNGLVQIYMVLPDGSALVLSVDENDEIKLSTATPNVPS